MEKLGYDLVGNFLGQLTVLSVVLRYIPPVGFSFGEFLVFTFAWLLSDLAVLICLVELERSSRQFNEMPHLQLKPFYARETVQNLVKEVKEEELLKSFESQK